jgi:hypothetical protein
VIETTIYKANDGSIWDRREQAERRDTLLGDIATALLPLGERPDDGDFANGEGYVQHEPLSVRVTKKALLHLAMLNIRGYDHIWLADPDSIHASGIAGRIIDDCNEPLARAWFRLMCIDGESREWGQPYYALHPEQGTHFVVHPTRAAGRA